ncbi:epoxyqueuosine reductase [Alishewanella longhuensis]
MKLACQQWLDAGYHGEMQYMAEHGMLRARPAELHPGTLSVISVRLDYLPKQAGFATNLADPSQAYISRYALGRDYHKLLRNRLKQLGQKISTLISDYNGRPLCRLSPYFRAATGATSGYRLDRQA